jgi:multimeric flavodoxin WrbA
MAKVLAVLASNRRKGWTAQLLERACKGAEKVDGVDVELIRLHDCDIRPCNACFDCIRLEARVCTLKDDMGGEGELYQKVKKANGIILEDPVFMWGSSALTHLFIERLYPFVLSGGLSGMPFGSISCASNQGFQYQAGQEIAKQTFSYGFIYLGAVPVHASYFGQGLQEAEALGEKLSMAAVKDHQEGRQTLTDQEKFRMYTQPFNVLRSYMENLTNGSMEFEDTMSQRTLRNHIFKREEAVGTLEKANEKIKAAFESVEQQEYEKARDALSQGSALWTKATWQEFLESEIIGVKQPDAYRPTD